MNLINRMINERQMKAAQQQVIRPGGEQLAKLVDATSEPLTVNIGGVDYPTFVLGANDIDSTNPVFWVT